MANKNFKVAMGILLFVIVMLVVIVMRRREDYGVFSHRSNLRGIDKQSRAHYTLEELKIMYPYNYWNEPNLSKYDKDIRKYHSKRFDPELLM